eukprot:SAG22_NODE_900_length_6611_cov_15.344134_1_plen_555_part_00
MYGALGALETSEPGMASTANLRSQDVRGWFRGWQAEYFEHLTERSRMLVEFNEACEDTIEYERLRQEAAANGLTEIPSVVEAKTSVVGPAVDPTRMLAALEAEHGVGKIQIKQFMQTAEFDLAGLPTTPHSSADLSEDYSNSSVVGNARRFMVEFAGAGALGLAVENVTFLSASSSGVGAMSFKLSAVSDQDVSAALNNSNFTSNFVDSMFAFQQAAADVDSMRRRLNAAMTIPADVLSSLGATILSSVASEGVSAVNLISAGSSLSVSNAVFVTELVIEVSIPPGMSTTDAASILDPAQIVGFLASAGVDVAAASITSQIQVVFEPTTTASLALPPAPGPPGGVVEVDNTITLGELGAPTGGGVEVVKPAEAKVDVRFELIVGITLGGLSFIGAAIAFWVAVRRRKKLAEVQLTQIVPTTASGKVHEKALKSMKTVKLVSQSGLTGLVEEKAEPDKVAALVMGGGGPAHTTAYGHHHGPRHRVPLPGTPEPVEPADNLKEDAEIQSLEPDTVAATDGGYETHPGGSLMVRPHAPQGVPKRPQPARSSFRKRRV